MTDERLIEEAAKAIRNAGGGVPFAWESLPEGHREYRRTQARAALAVFEAAHAPTDDEREALQDALKYLDTLHADRQIWYDDYSNLHDLVSSALRRSEVPEPSAEPKHDESCAEWCNHCQVCGEGIRYGSRCREHYQNQPQGEPSDAQVEAAHAPTDDEREALAIVQGAKDAYLEAYPGDDHRERFAALDRLAGGFRRSEVPEPSAEQIAAYRKLADRAADALRLPRGRLETTKKLAGLTLPLSVALDHFLASAAKHVAGAVIDAEIEIRRQS